MVQKASPKMMKLLNEAIARELQVIVQYMWQHVLWSGVRGFAVKDAFKSIAIDEMKHVEMIAERLNYFDGVPTTKPTPIFIGKNLKEMLEADRKDEEGAIELYKEIIELARKEGDDTTGHIFREILKDEEEHHDTFRTLLEKD